MTTRQSYSSDHSKSPPSPVRVVLQALAFPPGLSSEDRPAQGAGLARRAYRAIELLVPKYPEAKFL